ncbi:MAG: GtrA family protein [Prevotella sp.]|nr:GtrA family protein [Prevotella sp.]
MDSLKHQIWKFCKAQLSAQVASVFDFAVSLFFAEVVGIWYVYSTFIGALSGGILNCIVNYRWVFNAIGLNKKHVAIKYFMVWTGSILLNTGGTYLLTEFSKSYFAYSKIVVAVIVGLLWNYTMQNFFVYRDIHLAEKMRRTGKKMSHHQQFKMSNEINT